MLRSFQQDYNLTQGAESQRETNHEFFWLKSKAPDYYFSQKNLAADFQQLRDSALKKRFSG